MNKDRSGSILLEKIREKALFFGNFKLSNGAISDYYIDLCKITMSRKGLWLICREIASMLDDIEVDIGGIDSIGGPATGAIPLTIGLSTYTNIERTFYVRPDHSVLGNKSSYSSTAPKYMVEGNLNSEDRVLLIDDVATSGRSLYNAIREIEGLDSKIVEVITVVDREAGAKEFLNKKGYTLRSLFTASEILNFDRTNFNVRQA